MTLNWLYFFSSSINYLYEPLLQFFSDTTSVGSLDVHSDGYCMPLIYALRTERQIDLWKFEASRSIGKVPGLQRETLKHKNNPSKKMKKNL